MARKKRPNPTSIDQLNGDPGNPREIAADAAAGLGVSLRKFGDISGITFNRRTGELATGHRRVEKLRQLHGANLQIEYGDAPVKTPTGEEWRGRICAPGGHEYAVRVVDWPRSTQRAANLAANNEAIQGDYTDELSTRLAETQADDSSLFSDLLLDRLLDDVDEAVEEEPGEPEPATDADIGADELAARRAELAKQWKTKTGQVWRIEGKATHRLVIGNSTHTTVAGSLIEGVDFGVEGEPICLLTDPPYCSGGFQEAGKSAGSVGRRSASGTQKIANDQLSTRGYQALMRSMLECYPVGVAYVFCDWRMWVNLFDVVESSGIGVRNMVVWNKGSAGMGRGWRSQHETIMYGTRCTIPFDPKKSQGNVIECSRSRNKAHTTEKPVDLLCAIIDVTSVSKTFIDPFAGSGSTLIAADRMSRQALLCELDPKWAAVVLERAKLGGLKCELTTKPTARRKKATRPKPPAVAEEPGNA